MIRGLCEIIEEPAAVEQTMRRMAGVEAAAPKGAISSAPKRVVLKIVPQKIATWDHTKLGGKY
jgi:hypothetical protein